jgi:hypothetical protein
MRDGANCIRRTKGAQGDPVKMTVLLPDDAGC